MTADTAVALLRRVDTHGLRLFVLAYAEADPDALEELHALVYEDELFDWQALRPLLDSLAYDDERRTREAAMEVLDDLTNVGR